MFWNTEESSIYKQETIYKMECFMANINQERRGGGEKD